MVAGDEGAWRCFVSEYGGLINAVAARFGLLGDDRDELFQATCASAVRSIGALRSPERISSWVYNIAWRKAIDVKRLRQREVGSHGLAGLSHPERHLVQAASIEDELVRREEVLQLYLALDRLDARCRRLVTGLYLERLSYAELAGREDLPVGSIGPNRARCLERLRSLIESLSNPCASASTRGNRKELGTGKRRRRSEGTQDGR